jgi:hypothetical protein
MRRLLIGYALCAWILGGGNFADRVLATAEEKMEK